MSNGKITVKGHGVVMVKPDLSTITITSKSVDPSATEARNKASKIVGAVNRGLLGIGVKPENVKSSDFQFGENRNLRNDKMEGFYASNSITVRITDLSKVTELIDVCVKAGATGISGPNLAVEKPRPHQDEARHLAFLDAKAKAELYCKSANLSIAKVDSIHEVEGNYYGGSRGGGGKFALLDDDGEDTLVVGKTEVTIDLEVVFLVN